MESITIEILGQFAPNIKSLDISDKNINGLLDLSNFKELTCLNCSNNNINELFGLSHSIEYLNFSYNNINKLPLVLYKIKYLDCSYNNISKISHISDNLLGK